MPTLAEHVIYFLKVLDMSMREAFLIGDDEIAFGGAKPAWEDPLEEDVGIELGFAGKNTTQWRDAAAVADGYVEARRVQTAVD